MTCDAVAVVDDQFSNESVAAFSSEIWQAAGGETNLLRQLTFDGAGQLRSIFAVTDLAAAIGRRRRVGNCRIGRAEGRQSTCSLR